MKNRVRKLERETSVSESVEKVFDFFSKAENLNQITPAWLHFQIRKPSPHPIKEGAIIEYSLSLHGIPLKWKSRITEWNPPHHFADSQISGPYKLWRHSHRFEKKGNGTIIKDTVEYVVPGGILEPLIHFLFAKKDLEHIFDFREKIITRLFSP